MSQTEKPELLRTMPYRVMILLLQLLRIGTIIVIVIFLLSVVAPYIKDANKYQFICTARGIEKNVSSFIQGIIPTKVSRINLAPWVVIIVAFLLAGFFSSLKERYRTKAANLKIRRDYDELKARMHISDNSQIIAPLKEKIEKLQTADKTDREELLKLFAQTKKKLDSMGKDLAFLSIDVIDSTGLKEGEEKAVVEYDFREYKHFVENKLKANGTLKSTWTPDGVMSCFPTVDTAVKAAREVIDGLEAFNKHVKTMKRDFRVRCGINAGYVYFDDSLPLEEMSDHVIDVAGHMQKQASPNTICIAKPAIEPLQERSGFVPTSKIVDGYEVYIYMLGEAQDSKGTKE